MLNEWLQKLALGWLKANWKTLLLWVLARGKEGSTWSGVGLWIVASLHLPASDALMQSIESAGVGLCVVLAIVLKDKGVVQD